LTETNLHAKYKTLRGLEMDCRKARKHILEDIMTILETRGTLAQMDAAWVREAQATTKHGSTRHACKITIACSKRGVDNRYLTTILCVKMLRENGVPVEELSGMNNGKAGEGTWKANLQASDIDIQNMTTSQLLSFRTLPHIDMSGIDHLGFK